METSTISYRKLLRYFSSLSPKTLNPYHSLLFSYHSHSLHTLATSLQNFPSRHLSSCNFYTQNLHNKPPLCNSSCGSPSNSSKNLSFYNFSCVLPSNCNLDSYQLHKKQSLCNFSYGSSSNSSKNLSFDDLSSVLPSNCYLESYQLQKRQPFCNSSSGSASKWPLNHPILTSTGILNMYRCSSSYRCLVYGNASLVNARFGSVFRFFSASSHDGSMKFDEDNEQEEVDTSDFDAFLGEIKGNDVHTENVPSKSPKGNSLVAAKPLSKRFGCGFKSSSPYGDVHKERSIVPKRISEIIGIIRSNDDDMECKLSSVAENVYLQSTNEVFEALNCQKISGLRFFRWVQRTNHKLRRTAGFYSLIINNCGWLNDYETMQSLLKEFRSKKICLTEKAFEFLPLFGSSKASIEESIRRLVYLLDEVGGSSRNSGIHALIQMLCRLGLFDMAKFVIEITERTVSHYNVLIREKCSRGHIEEAHGIIKEMREFGCDPDAKTYNYLLGSLCKTDRMDEAHSLLEEMKEKGTAPDALSFEIFIYFLCRLGKFDHAIQCLDQMASEGARPRFTTHAAIIKAFINAEQYEEAYKYVIDSSLKDPQSSNMIYTLLANLHEKNGDPISALKIILEMMDKGLMPNSRVYFKVVSRLQNSGKGSLAKDLKNRYSRFKLASHSPTS